ELRGLGSDLSRREVARGVANEALLFGEIEIHRCLFVSSLERFPRAFALPTRGRADVASAGRRRERTLATALQRRRRCRRRRPRACASPRCAPGGCAPFQRRTGW